VTSREDLGRLAYAAYCDMTGRPFRWSMLPVVEQSGWMHAAVVVRDRLTLGISHAYRPDEQEESAMAKTTLHGGNEEPTINATDDATLYERLRAEGRDDVEWTGDGPAPGSEPEATPEPEPAAPERKPTKQAKSTGRASTAPDNIS
jgi:hypothetical protein